MRNTQPTVTLLADRVFAAHTLLTLCAALFYGLTGKPLHIAAFAVLWLLTLVIWAEWKHT